MSTPESRSTGDRIRRASRSLQVRIPVRGMAVLLLSLTVVTVLAYAFLYQYGAREVDQAIARERGRFATSVAGLVADELREDPTLDRARAVERAVRRHLELNPPSDAHLAVVELEDGRRLVPTGALPALQSLMDTGGLPEAPVGQVVTVDSPAGPLRVTAVAVELDGDPVAILRIHAPLAPVRDQALASARLIALAALISLVAGGLLLAGSLRRSLRPLGDLTRSARITNLDELSTRVEVPDTGDEVAVLASEFNVMLDRIDEAVSRQAWLIASVGHELRTPVTIARGHLDLLASTASSPAVDEAVTIVRGELVRISGMVEDLLAIARSDTDDFVRPREVHLVQWFEDLELKMTGHPASGHLTLVAPPPITLWVDPERLTQAVTNLIVNAWRHNAAGTPVRVVAEGGDGWIDLVVSDEGQGVPAEVRARVFEPFVRHGDAEGSTGLGLSVVRAVVDAHGGDLSMETSSEGTAVTLSLPTAAPSTAGGSVAGDPVRPQGMPTLDDEDDSQRDDPEHGER